MDDSWEILEIENKELEIENITNRLKLMLLCLILCGIVSAAPSSAKSLEASCGDLLGALRKEAAAKADTEKRE